MFGPRPGGTPGEGVRVEPAAHPVELGCALPVDLVGHLLAPVRHLVPVLGGQLGATDRAAGHPHEAVGLELDSAADLSLVLVAGVCRLEHPDALLDMVAE